MTSRFTSPANLRGKGDIRGQTERHIRALQAAINSAEASLADYLPLAGGTMAGDVDMGSNDLLNVLSITGLAEASWTPALTAITTDPTLGSGSSTSGRYLQIGNFVFAWGIIQFGSSGVAAGTGEYLVSLPVTSSTDGTALAQIFGIGHLLDSGTTNQVAAPTLHDSSRFRMYAHGSANRVGAAVPWTWAANDRISFAIGYFR